MKIIIITGQKASGKSTYLKNLVKDDFDGLITSCIDRNTRKYQFELIKTKKKIDCCYYDNGMKFNENGFELVNNYLSEIDKYFIIIDEIGWLELESKGLYKGLTSLLSNEKIEKLYISMRYDIYDKLIKKFGILKYELIDLSL